MAIINGNTFNNLLNGTVDADTISGGNGNDTLYGYEGADKLEGGNGNDLLVGGDNAAVLGNVIINGSFEDYGAGTNQGWGYSTVAIPGWTLESGPAYEIVFSGHRGVNSSEGGFWLDMDATAGNITISQDIAGLTNGQNYTVKVDAATSHGATRSTYTGATSWLARSLRVLLP